MSNSTSSGGGGGGGHAFVVSPAQISLLNRVELGFAIPGVCVCFLVLLSYAVAALAPRARKRLDRVSFRLLAYTLVFHVAFGIAFVAVPSAPGPGCTAGAFAINLFLCLSTFFTTCIAINLQLVLVHGIDGKRMEKYYVLGTVLLSLLLNVLPLALNQFGWDKASSVCWYKNPDNTKRLHWLIGTQSFWISLAATIEAVCSAIVLVWMYRFNRTTVRLIKAASQSTLNRSAATKTSDATLYRHTRATARSTTSTQLTQDPRYRKIILRITLYPLVSLIMNYSTVALDLNNTIKGLGSELDYRLLLLDLIMYGLRTLVYGLLAATDPAFISAVRELRGAGRDETQGTSVYMLTTFEFAEGRGKPSEEAAAAAAPTTGIALAERGGVEGGGGGGEGGEGEVAMTLTVEEKRRLERQL